MQKEDAPVVTRWQECVAGMDYTCANSLDSGPDRVRHIN